MTRHFVPPGEKPPPRPPGFKFPIWISHGVPPKPPRRPRPLVIGKPWPTEEGQ